MAELSLEMFAYAKINLALAITGVRPDGFHDLQTVMQSIALKDRVTLKRRGREIQCLCGRLSGPQNLAYRAAVLFQDKTGIHEGIEILIGKQIPTQAGLGGGSSDAAAVLMGLNQMYHTPLSFAEITELANLLGSDVAFCLKGGTQWAEGKGERLSDLPSALDMAMVIAKPTRGVNTTLAYKRFDNKKVFTQLDKNLWRKTLESGDTRRIASLLYNDLETPSMKIVPEIKEIKRVLVGLGCLGALMSGSGSSVFGLARDHEHAAYIAREFNRKITFDCWVVKSNFMEGRDCDE